MKILITTDSWFQTNGVTTSVKTLKAELQELGHDVRVLGISPNHKSFKDGTDYFIASASFPIYPDARVSIRYHDPLLKEIVEWRPDIIHIQTEFTSQYLARRIIRKTSSPSVSTCHTKYEDYIGYFCPSKRLGKYLVKKLSQKFYDKSKVLIVPSQKIEELSETYELTCPTVIIPTGIDLSLYDKQITEEERNNIRVSYNIPADAKILVTVSRLGKEKNVQELIEYLPENDNLYLMIVGDGPYREKLEKKASKKSNSSHIIFTGNIPHEDIYKYYQTGDIFVYASTSETQGLTYVEALANSLPMLCRDDKCLIGVVDEDKNGYAYKDKDDFEDKLNRLLSMQEADFTALKRHSKEIAESFSKENFGLRVESLYNKIISSQAD